MYDQLLDPVANLQEIQRIEVHVQLHEEAVCKIQTLGNCRSNAVFFNRHVLLHLKGKESSKGEPVD